jgi:hypothetical protein
MIVAAVIVAGVALGFAGARWLTRRSKIRRGEAHDRNA